MTKYENSQPFCEVNIGCDVSSRTQKYLIKANCYN